MEVSDLTEPGQGSVESAVQAEETPQEDWGEEAHTQVSKCGLLQQFTAVPIEEYQPEHPVPATGGEDAEVTGGARVAEASPRTAGASIRDIHESVSGGYGGNFHLNWIALSATACYHCQELLRWL